MPICVTPLASPYALLPRAHTYSLCLALLLPLPQGWLFRAALAAFTTRTAISSVDAIVLFAKHRNHPHHPAALDLVVAAEYCALGSLMAIWLLVVSRRGSETRARGLVRCWAVAVVIGLIIGALSLGEVFSRDMDESPVCGGAEMQTGDLFDLEGTGGKVEEFRDRMNGTSIVLAVGGLLAAMLPRPNLRMRAAKGDVEASPTPEVVGSPSGPSSAGGRILSAIRYLLVIAVPALAVFVCYSTETFVLRSGLPSAEGMESVGQWGVWAATGVVVFATAVNAAKEGMGMGKETDGHLYTGQDGVVRF